VRKHLFDRVAISDDSIPHRPNGADVRWRSTEHVVRIAPDSFNAAAGGIEGHNRRLSQSDCAPRVDAGIHRPEVDGYIGGGREHAHAFGRQTSSIPPVENPGMVKNTLLSRPSVKGASRRPALADTDCSGGSRF
jgi:hypothetical protein